MGSFCDYLEHEALHHVLGTSYTPPTIYLCLSTTDATDAGASYTEPATANGYARKAVASWQPGASRTTYNTGTITFDPNTTSDWGTIGYWFLSDSGTRAAGNTLCYGSFAVAKAVVVGNTCSVAAGELDITISASGAGGGWCDLLCNEMLDHIFGVGSYTPPSIYIGLSTTTPADAGTGATEPSGNNYSRVTYAGGWTVTGGAGDNTGAITFATPSGSWGLCTHFVAANHASNAYGASVNLFWGDITDQTPNNGDVVDFPIGAMDLTLS
jgi:hypothetical protein